MILIYLWPWKSKLIEGSWLEGKNELKFGIQVVFNKMQLIRKYKVPPHPIDLCGLQETSNLDT